MNTKILISLFITFLVLSIAVPKDTLRAQNGTIPQSTIYLPFISNSPPNPEKKHLGVSFTTPQQFRQEFFEIFKPNGVFNWVHWEEDMYNYSQSYMPIIWGHRYRRTTPTCHWCETGPNYEEIRALSKKYPYRTWLFWNEPSLQSQADTEVSFAVAHTKEWVRLIEPNSEWACCGVGLFPRWASDHFPPTQGFPWMDGYIANDGPIPDYWHVHFYLSRDLDEYKSVINRWWDWWEINGQGKQVIISETALLCSSQDTNQSCVNKQKELMTYLATDLLHDERIKYILWWKSHIEPTVGNQYEWLGEHLNNEYIVNELGQHFLDLQQNQPDN